eukprot:scaffold200187_cov19-Tisochrysis_lutea.AAC.1
MWLMSTRVMSKLGAMYATTESLKAKLDTCSTRAQKEILSKCAGRCKKLDAFWETMDVGHMTLSIPLGP